MQCGPNPKPARPAPKAKNLLMSKFSTYTDLWDTFNLGDDSEYRLQGEMKDAFGFYAFRSYPTTSKFKDFQCVLKVMDYEDNDDDVTEFTIAADMKDRKDQSRDAPIDLRTSDIKFDHETGNFLLENKIVSGKEALDYVWGLHLSPTFKVRGFPLRLKRATVTLIGEFCSLLDSIGEWVLQKLFGYKLDLTFESIHKGYKSSQMKVDDSTQRITSLGESTTFEIFKVKIKTSSGLYWCFFVAFLSIIRKYITPQFGGIFSNPTYGLAWSVILLWFIDRILPRAILHFVNFAIRTRTWFLWNFASLRKVWFFYV